MSKFFRRLSYSFGNEDWRSEKEALKIQAGERVLCITASGDRPLNLLLDECESMDCIDANPIQNHLLNLKCSAMQVLKYEDYLAFLGASPCKGSERYTLFLNLEPYLEKESLDFWKKNHRMIRKGILYQGQVERQCKKIVSPLIRMLHGRKVKKLFEFTDISEQRKFTQKSLDKLYLKKIFDFIWKSLPTRLLFRFIVDDPGLYANLNQSVNIGTYFYKRMSDSLQDNLAKESLLLSIILKGKVGQEAFPPYLTPEGVSIIKSRIDRLKVKNMDLIMYLESLPDNSIDCFSLSDVASYLNQQVFEKMLKEIKRVARPNARFSLRQFLSDHHIPEVVQDAFCRDPELEKKLEKEDRCFVYRFMAGQIKK